MAYVIDMPPAFLKEAQDYERATGRSLQAMIIAYVTQEMHRQSESDDWEAQFNAQIRESTAHLEDTVPYVFSRGDAYSED